MGLFSGKNHGPQAPSNISKKQMNKSIQYSTTLLDSNHESIESKTHSLRSELQREILNVNLARRAKFYDKPKCKIAQGSPSGLLTEARKTRDKHVQNDCTLARIDKSMNVVAPSLRDQCDACKMFECEIDCKCSPRCRALSLGTAEYRTKKNECDGTMLIGGSRVRVKKGLRTNK